VKCVAVHSPSHIGTTGG